jgi:hypothetical protein
LEKAAPNLFYDPSEGSIPGDAEEIGAADELAA